MSRPMPSGRRGRASDNTPASDVTPDPVNFRDTSGDEYTSGWETTYDQITGINSEMSLSFSITSSSIGNTFLYYDIGDSPILDNQALNDLGWLFDGVYQSGTITIQNNKYLTLCVGVQNRNSIQITGSVSIINESDSGSVLDTFNFDISGGGVSPA